MSSFNAFRDDPAEWLKHEHGVTLTPFQHRVMYMLGAVAGGIHNAPIDWQLVEWDIAGHGICVNWHGELATIDTCKLTMLVFMACEARIRFSISGGGQRTVKLRFWQRKAQGRASVEHPDLGEFIAVFREQLPADHPLLYRNHPERQAEAAAAAPSGGPSE